MIENDDTSTQPQQAPDDGTVAADTIQIPAAQAEAQVPPTPTPTPAATGAPDTNAPTIPYMSVDDLLALRLVRAPRLSPDGSLDCLRRPAKRCRTERHQQRHLAGQLARRQGRDAATTHES